LLHAMLYMLQIVIFLLLLLIYFWQEFIAWVLILSTMSNCWLTNNISSIIIGIFINCLHTKCLLRIAIKLKTKWKIFALPPCCFTIYKNYSIGSCIVYFSSQVHASAMSLLLNGKIKKYEGAFSDIKFMLNLWKIVQLV
jgi:hypothetical protein